MALYTYTSKRDFSKLNSLPSAAQTELYNQIGRDAGTGTDENFFVKRGRSIENAIGTSLAAPVSDIKSGGVFFKGTENIATENLRKDNKARMNDVAKKYGYNSWNDWQDAFEEARKSGDTARISQFEEQSKDFQAQANANADKTKQKADNFKDYMENNYVSKKINQDNTKFAGSAIKTLSTAADLTGLATNPLANAAQGGLEGLADELEANGGTLDVTRPFSQGIKASNWDNFDAKRAGQNALVGAATGAVTGALNNSLSNALAKRAARKAAAQALTNGGAEVAKKAFVPELLKTVGTGAARGALSGAVGGATGAGLSSALNGVEFTEGVQNAIKGAVQGAGQGAISGATMAGVNYGLSKTPGVGKFYNNLQTAKQDWDRSGKNFDERLTNTLTSGDSAVGDWLMNKRQSNVLGAAGNIGNRVQDVSGAPKPRPFGQNGAQSEVDELVNVMSGGEHSWNEFINRFQNMSPEARNYLLENASSYGLDYDTQKTLDFFDKNASMPTDDWLNAHNEQLSNIEKVKQYANNVDPNTVVEVEDYQLADRLGLDMKSIPGTSRKAFLDNVIKMLENRANVEGDYPFEFGSRVDQTPTTAKGWAKQAGKRIVEDVNNSNLGNRVKDVTNELMGSEDNFDYPDDIKNMKIVRNDIDPNYDPNDPANEPITVDEALARVGLTRRDRSQDRTARVIELGEDQDYSIAPEQQSAWDDLVREHGYANWNSLAKEFLKANPDYKPTGNDAGAVLGWMDKNPGNQIPNSRYSSYTVEEPEAVSRTTANVYDEDETPTTSGGWLKRAGQRIKDNLKNKSVGLSLKVVDDEDPQQEVYNALSANRKATPVVEEEATVEQVADQDVIPSKTSKEGKMRYARGKELLAQYGPVDQPRARSANYVKAIQDIADAGFTRPEDVERMADVITGSNGEVSKLTRNLIQSAKPVNTFDGNKPGQNIREFIDNSIELNSLHGTAKGEAVKNTILANLQSLPSRTDGSLSFKDSPEDVFKVVQNLEASAAELEGRGGSTYHRPTIENIHQAQVLKDTASLLKDRLFDGVDVKQALTPDVAQNLKNYAPGNVEFANYVDDVIMGANNIKDLRKAQAPWVQMSKYIDNAYTQAATVGGRMATNASDLSRILTTRNGLLRAGIDTAWNSNAARRGRAAIYDKMADKAAAKTDSANNTAGAKLANFNQAVTSSDPATQVYSALGRNEGLSNAKQVQAAQYLNEDGQAPSAAAGYVAPLGVSTTYGGNTLESLSATPTSSYSTVSGISGQMPTFSSLEEEKKVYFFPPTGDQWTDMISRAMRRAKDAEDYDAMNTLYGMYQNSVGGTSNSSSEVKLTDKQRQANAAARALQDFEGAEHNFAYDVSDIPVAGWLANFGGNEYASKAEALALQIGYMLSGTTTNKEEAKQIGMAYVPQPRDSQALRQSKLAQLRGIISDYQQTYAE